MNIVSNKRLSKTSAAIFFLKNLWTEVKRATANQKGDGDVDGFCFFDALSYRSKTFLKPEEIDDIEKKSLCFYETLNFAKINNSI